MDLSLLNNPALARIALEVARPSIEAILNGFAKRQEMHVRIFWIDQSQKCGYIDLADAAFGDEATWEFPYRDVTAAKSRKSALTGFSSRDVHQKYPFLIDPEVDGEWWGTALRGRLGVSASGVEAEYDEAASEMVVSILFAICQVASNHRST